MNLVFRYISSLFMDLVFRYISIFFKGYFWFIYGYIFLKILNFIMCLLFGVVFLMSGDVCFY